MHQALRPHENDTEPPIEVICCLVNFQLKEDILKSARAHSQLLTDPTIPGSVEYNTPAIQDP